MYAQTRAIAPERSVSLLVKNATIPIELNRVQITGEVSGLAVRSRVELEFRNPNNQALEGELHFPLSEGESVIGFSLDIDGDLRPAVPIEKVKGRQVFEDITRSRVDPALLESTSGNVYKLRVYPLPSRGTRRVVLELAGTLSLVADTDQATARYTLPLRFSALVQNLDVSFQVLQRRLPQRVSAKLGSERLTLEPVQNDAVQLTLARTAYVGRSSLQLDVEDNPKEPHITTSEFRDSAYFYAQAPVPMMSQPRRDPSTVGIVWDASGSGGSRDHSLEFSLLDRYFKSIGSVEVELSVVRDTAEPLRRFSVQSGDWISLREHLNALPYDGATSADQMVVPASADVALLFSDGLGNYGQSDFPPSPVPLYTISSSPTADWPRLLRLAEISGGALIDLVSMSAQEAVHELRSSKTRLVGLSAEGATDLVVDGHYPRHGRLFVAGRLTQPEAAVFFDLEAPDGTRSKVRFPIARNASARTTVTFPVAAYKYAELKLKEMEAHQKQNREAIRRLGMHFGLATSGTSLIVLDAVEDYIQHQIEPPETLRLLYKEKLTQRRDKEEFSRINHVQKVIERFSARKAWWDTEFPKDEIPRPLKSTEQEVERARRSAMDEAQQRRQESRSLRGEVPTSPTARTRAPAPIGAFASFDDGRIGDGAISLRKWAPDSTYARRLRAAAIDSLYAIYLDERPSHTDSTAFFLDAADIFFERGQVYLGHRILSNLAEMQLENRHILRLLAYRLLQTGNIKQALSVLEKVLDLAPDEPQSHRDLGLALATDGQFQHAVELLWTVVSRPWDTRFPDIEQVALAELNATIAQATEKRVSLDTSGMEPRLLHNLPLSLRAVLAWDADNTDMDLHVIDPNGEEASYARQLTYQGGRMSSDFTGGYGPEEFALRQAKPGTYTVMARFYGHRQQIVSPTTTLMLRLTTDFGTARQKSKEVVLRLSGEGQMIMVGTFQVSEVSKPKDGTATTSP